MKGKDVFKPPKRARTSSSSVTTTTPTTATCFEGLDDVVLVNPCNANDTHHHGADYFFVKVKGEANAQLVGRLAYQLNRAVEMVETGRSR